MRKKKLSPQFPRLSARLKFGWLAGFLFLWAGSGNLLFGASVQGRNPDFLIESWEDHEGVPESSALTVAQTPDGYIWVGSNEGLLRFNGIQFLRAEQFSTLVRLEGVISLLQVDHSGRMWAGGEGRLSLYDHGLWQGISGTNLSLRSIAEDADGSVFLGGLEGQLYAVNDGRASPAPRPEGIKPSGVFCLTDAKDGALWLANRGTIVRRAAANWKRMVPAEFAPTLLIAAPAQGGGIWVYTPGQLRKFQADGSIKSFAAPILDQPRNLIEDRDGMIWITTISRGLFRFRPGGPVNNIETSNGLTHGAIRCILQDREGNFWVGGSLNGLSRLKPRQFITIDRTDGLPDNVARTITEVAPGEIIVGTHGGGIAHIQNGKVEGEPSFVGEDQGQYVWSLLKDRTGRLWIGTYSDGLFVQEGDARRSFPLPPMFDNSIGHLFEDSRGRIWAGGPGGLGVIESNSLTTCFSNSLLAGVAITALAEDTNAGTMWIGTYAHGLFRMDSAHFDHLTPVPGLPGNRVSSLAMDGDCLWIGIFEHGLAARLAGKTTLIGPEQGFPGGTVGSLLDDGRGFFWLGTTHGILRVATSELHRLLRPASGPPAVFQVFTASDGLGSEYCVEGYQPTALRDHAGHLWFATDDGVVTVNPAKLRLNTVPPPVAITTVTFTSRSGSQVSSNLASGSLVIPAGATELKFGFDGLSYTAPEKINFKYQLEGANPNWITTGHGRELHFRDLPPGNYVLHLTAANNDGVWNPQPAARSFTVQPFLWQTLWFRLVVITGLAAAGAFAVWRITRREFQRRIEQLQEQRRLEQERARHAIVMENTSDLVVFADSQGRVLHVNPAGRKLVGLQEEGPVREFTLAQLQPPQAAARVAAEGIPAARQHGTWETETVLRHRDGHEIPVSFVLIVHKDADGHDSFISAIARDITSRKQTEAELQRREKYFRWLIEHASDSITVINELGVVTYQSSSGERTLGYPPESLLGRNLFDLVAPEDLPKARASLAQTLAQLDVPITLLARLRHRDGSWRTIQTVGTSIQTESGEKQIVLNARDVTEHLRLEDQLRQAQKMEAIGQLAGGVAHDFNNILTSLRLQAELIGMTENLPPGINEGLQQISADTHRAADLTRQLLLFSRRQVMQSRVLDLNQVVRNVAKMLQRIIREDIELELNLHPVPLMTSADGGMIDQVLINLAVNARDAMPHGGLLRIETREAVVGENEAPSDPDAAPGRYVCFSVRDTGGGIDPAILPRIFEPFFTTKEAGKGTGLGLATVFGIIKQHKGWIKLVNVPGQGATFHVFLPASNAPSSAPAEVISRPKPRGGSETILLVEDEPAVRKPTRMILERHGYKVLEAADGMEALVLWQAHRHAIALLLTDLVMPGEVGGRELGRQLKIDRPGLKVIFASGYSADIAGRDFKLQPDEAFIQKPFVTDRLLEVVRSCLDSQTAG